MDFCFRSAPTLFRPSKKKQGVSGMNGKLAFSIKLQTHQMKQGKIIFSLFFVPYKCLFAETISLKLDLFAKCLFFSLSHCWLTHCILEIIEIQLMRKVALLNVSINCFLLLPLQIFWCLLLWIIVHGSCFEWIFCWS